MKKLMVLMLVFGLASTAGATISLQIDGSSASPIVIDKEEVSSVEVQIYSDDSASWLGYCILESGSAPGAYFTNPQIYPAAGDNAYIQPYFETGWGDGYEMQVDWLSSPPVAPGLQFTIDLNIAACSLGDSGVVSLWDDRVGYNPEDFQGKIAFTIIPEPATISLLAISGLAILKKRRR